VPTLFFSYSHADEGLRDELEKQLAMLKRQGVIETWHDRRIGAGSDFGREIDDHVNSDDIILLLVSADFLASDYCYDREMLRAMERHEAGEAVVIPVILRACDWHHAPFGKLNAVPRDGRPVTLWPDRDQAFLEVAKAVRSAAARFGAVRAPAPGAISPGMDAAAPAAPRSSNLRVAKRFTQRDMDQFKLESFEYMARFFENSAAELTARNPGIEADFQRIDAARFITRVYRDGQKVSACTIFLNSGFGSDGIAYVSGETTASNALNESLSVEADDQSLFLRSMGMASMMRERDEKLTQEGAAETYWGLLIEPLQRA
jgi:hypothetical protein